MDKYKMICLDVDGTLLNDEKRISADTKNILTRMAATGYVKLIIASSRMPESIELVAAELHTPGPIIAYNGALVLGEISATGEREVLLSKFIAGSAAADIVAFALKYPVHIGIFHNNEWVVNDGGYWTQREIRNTGMTPVIYDLGKKISGWEESAAGAQKIMIRGGEQELGAIETFLKENLLVQVVAHRIKDTILEITPVNISKASAVAFLCGRLKTDQQQVMAFGDSANDIDLLKWAGRGIAMGNAAATVKEAADEVALSNNEDGIAVVLKRYYT